jgi:hypothetical protein
MRRFTILMLICLYLLFSGTSCTKVVKINLNASAPKLIIEGNISDQTISCLVKLTKSVNFDELNSFPKVSGATVSISDNIGNNYVLIETSPGLYIAPGVNGIPGRTYTLSVTVEGTTYTAVSYMPAPVSIDTISQESFMMGFGSPTKIKYVRLQFHDEKNVENYYRFVEEINGRLLTSIHADNDILRDGNIITQEIIHRDSTLHTGDNVKIYLYAIDRPVFSYLEQLRQATSGYGGQTASPANPVSNFTNGALGFFSANAVRSKSIRIK